jgi:LmbE family N-acetylglucosaminyl deacetylase
MKRVTRWLTKRLARAARPYLSTHGLLQTSKIFQRSSLVWNPGDEAVLVLAPHMDDEVIGCGGTLARHVQQGARVSVVFLTDGSGGGRTDSSQDISVVRKAEAVTALASLKISEVKYLDARDGDLMASPGIALRLREVLQRVRPRLVYLPFFLEEHPDHRAASRVLLDAVNGEDLDFQCMGYEVWTPLFPNCFVNIDAVIDLKRTALTHYQSQLAEADYLHTAMGLNAYRSSAFLGGTCRYAEAFCALTLADYRAGYERYARETS